MQEDGQKTVTMAGVDEGAELIREYMALVDVERSVGDPITEGGKTVIPLGEVGAALGFGFGGGGGGTERIASGGGGGGGGRIWTRPVAAIIIEDDQVRVEPVLDATKVVIAFISALAAIFMALWRMRRVQDALE